MLQGAVRALAVLPGVTVLAVSRAWSSPPAGGVARRPFLNGAVLVAWTGTPLELLDRCKALERRFGRRAGPRWTDRPLDIDLLWASRPWCSARLQVPHPRLMERPFAWRPAREVAPWLPRGHGRPDAVPVAPIVTALPLAKPTSACESPTPPGAATMKFFIDTANLDHIRQASRWGIVDGVTTNPSLIAKEGGDFIETVAEICTIIDGPVSAEVVAESCEEMVTQGRLLARIHDNVVVKVPLTEEGIAATAQLSAAGIKTNVTLCFSPVQALLAAKAGATYISPFVGRVDDIGRDGTQLIEEIVHLYANYPDLETQVLAASIRHPKHLLDSAMAGAHVATIPFGVMKKLFGHPLTDIGNAKFNKAWEGVPDSDIVGQVTGWLERNGR
jgi:transaldolase